MIFRMLRVGLDALYRLGGILASVALFGVFAIIVAQMVARWSGISLRGSTDYAGYLMAASAFLAFATALDRGYHIRVTMLHASLGKRAGRWLEVWAFGLGATIAIYVAWYACKAVVWSRKLGDLSQGLDATPLWIPQTTMAAGAILLAIAFLDHFLRVLFTGRHGIRDVSDDVVRSE